MNLNELTIEKARTKLDKGEVSSLDLTDACLKAIEDKDGEVKACLSVFKDSARLEAKEADKRLKNGEKGALLGIPYLCKDILMTKGKKTTAASKILADYIAPYDATVVKKLKKAGAVLLGKTNLDEFAHGASTENSAFFPTRNPHDLSRVPGGSSGGSTAAVASDMCLFSIGSDTGGSLRQPASFCGVVGLKPSYGLVSRFGLLSMTSSTDVVGPVTKTVADAKIVLKIISGKDEFDATSAPAGHLEKSREYVKHASPILAKKISEGRELFSKEEKPLKGIKVGLAKEYFPKGLDKEINTLVQKKADKLKELGADIVEVSLPYTSYGIPVYYIITPSEISSNLARFDGIFWGHKSEKQESLLEFYKANRGAGFGAEAKRRIMLGTYALSAGYYDAYYKKAQAVRTLIIEDFNNAFKEVDFLLTPTSPHPAFKLGEQSSDPLTMYMEDIFVTGASLAGLPAISIPAGTVKREDKDLPVGAQIIAPRFFDNEMLEISKLI